MAFKFKSRVTGDIVMLAADARHVLQLLGEQPTGKGIIRVEELDRAIQALERIASEPMQDPGPSPNDETGSAAAPSITLRQLTFPLLQMLRRCRDAGEPVIWQA